jgi:hypothetical protein
MKLSEAIRVGSKMNKPTKKGWFNRNEHGEFETCALIAAAIGAGAVRPCGNHLEIVNAERSGSRYDGRMGAEVDTVAIPADWYPAVDSVEPFPCGCKIVNNVFGCIQHLHDEHQWSREAVAEWVEVIENKLEQAAVETAPACRSLVKV